MSDLKLACALLFSGVVTAFIAYIMANRLYWVVGV